MTDKFVPLELYDLQTRSKAAEFGRAVCGKVTQGLKGQPYTDAVTEFSRILFEQASYEEIAMCLGAIDAVKKDYDERLQIALNKAANAAKRKGKLNLRSGGNDDYDDGDHPSASEDEDSGKPATGKKGPVAAARTVLEDDVEELTMEELEKRAAQEQAENQRRAKEEAERKALERAKQQENEERQRALLEKQRRVVEAPEEGFEVISKGNTDKKPKGKGGKGGQKGGGFSLY